MGAPAKTTADKSAARREQAAALHESITAKVAQLTDTDAWTAYLTAQQRSTRTALAAWAYTKLRILLTGQV